MNHPTGLPAPSRGKGAGIARPGADWSFPQKHQTPEPFIIGVGNPAHAPRPPTCTGVDHEQQEAEEQKPSQDHPGDHAPGSWSWPSRNSTPCVPSAATRDHAAYRSTWETGPPSRNSGNQHPVFPHPGRQVPGGRMWLQAHHNPHHALPGHRRLDLVHLGSNPRGLPTGGPGGHQGRHPAACGITDGKGQDLRARRSQVLSPGDSPRSPPAEFTRSVSPRDSPGTPRNQPAPCGKN